MEDLVKNVTDGEAVNKLASQVDTEKRGQFFEGCVELKQFHTKLQALEQQLKEQIERGKERVKQILEKSREQSTQLKDSQNIAMGLMTNKEGSRVRAKAEEILIGPVSVKEPVNQTTKKNETKEIDSSAKNLDITFRDHNFNSADHPADVNQATATNTEDPKLSKSVRFSVGGPDLILADFRTKLHVDTTRYNRLVEDTEKQNTCNYFLDHNQNVKKEIKTTTDEKYHPKLGTVWKETKLKFGSLLHNIVKENEEINKSDIKRRELYAHQERKKKNQMQIKQLSLVIDQLCPAGIYQIDNNYRLHLHNTSKFAINLDSEYASQTKINQKYIQCIRRCNQMPRRSPTHHQMTASYTNKKLMKRDSSTQTNENELHLVPESKTTAAHVSTQTETEKGDYPHTSTKPSITDKTRYGTIKKEVKGKEEGIVSKESVGEDEGRKNMNTTGQQEQTLNTLRQPRFPNLQSFDGTNWNAYKIQFTETAAMFDWDNQQKIDNLLLHVRGKALKFFSTRPSSVQNNFIQMMDQMSIRFGTEELPKEEQQLLADEK